MAQSPVCHGDGRIGLQINSFGCGAGKDVGINAVLRDVVFGQQGDVAAGAGDAGVQGQVGIDQRARCVARTRLARAEQDVTGSADTGGGRGRTAIHRDGPTDGLQHQMSTRTRT